MLYTSIFTMEDQYKVAVLQFNVVRYNLCNLKFSKKLTLNRCQKLFNVSSLHVQVLAVGNAEQGAVERGKFSAWQLKKR